MFVLTYQGYGGEIIANVLLICRLVEFCYVSQTISRVMLGQAKHPTNPWVCGLLLIFLKYSTVQDNVDNLLNLT